MKMDKIEILSIEENKKKLMRIAFLIFGWLLSMGGIWFASWLFNNLPGYQMISFFTGIILFTTGIIIVVAAAKAE